MSAFDLDGLGPAQAVSSGLSGLLEAYKIKLAKDTEYAKIRQSGYNEAMQSDSLAAHLAENKRQFDVEPNYVQIPDPNNAGGTMTVGTKGNHIISLTRNAPAGKATADKKTQESLQSAAGAYSAMDDALGLADQFAPKSSAAAATAKVPYTWLKSKLMQTAPENNLADKSAEAATLFATAVNKAGGGRMSDAEIQNMATAMGGHGIGDTVDNLAIKHGQLKDNLAIKLGIPRGDIEAYVAQRKTPAGRLLSMSGLPGAANSADVPSPAAATGAGSMFRIKASDGSMHDVPNIEAAKKIDPGLTVVTQ